MTRWLTIVLSLIGLAIGVWAVTTADEKPPVLPLARPASVNPFATGVAALGIIEPADRDVGVVAPESGLVVEVLVGVGDRVEAGTALFRLDSRRLEADLLRARSAVDQAQREIDRWRALPRAEDLPPLRAAVARAEATLKDREELLKLTREAAAKGSGTEREVSANEFGVLAARADVERAKGELAKVESGGWEPDLKVAEAALAAKRAEVEALTLLIERLTVRAPRGGTVLRREIEAGEHASTDRRSPSMIVGDLSHLGVRAQVDEEDIGLVTPGARALARTRGAVVIEVPLRLVRIEPYARPKSDLTGANLERVDTRVSDVGFERAPEAGKAAPRVVPGQAVDVFIEAVGRAGG
jgi:multidrug efflux pump subunit AcrA (membrane-fusion protein)